MLPVLLTLLAATPLELTEQAQRVLQVPGGNAVKVMDPSILDARLVGADQLLVIALRPGASTVTVTGADGRRLAWAVKVNPFSPFALLAQAREFLGEVPALVWLDGRCMRFDCASCSREQQARVEQFVALHACVRAVHRLTPPRPQAEVLALATKLLGEGPTDTPGLELQVVDSRLVLTGEVRTAEDLRRVNLVRARYPEVGLGARLAAGLSE